MKLRRGGAQSTRRKAPTISGAHTSVQQAGMCASNCQNTSAITIADMGNHQKSAIAIADMGNYQKR